MRGVVRVPLPGPRPGTARRVRPRRVQLGDDARQHAQVVPLAPGLPGEPLLPAPVPEPPQVLVVAVPQHQRGMRHQPYDVLPRLGLHLAPQRLLLRVGRAREREVLPDQQPQLVAGVVEVLALVDPAAPDPHEVDTGVGRLREPLAVPLAGDPGRKHVVRDPVHPRANSRSPLTTRVNPVPCASARRSSSTVRNPTRRRQHVERAALRDAASTRRRTAAVRRIRAATTAPRPAPPAVRPRSVARRPVRDRAAPPTRASSVSPASTRVPARRRRATRRARRPVRRVTSGRTRAIRAVDQRSSRTGRQIPAVTRVGPQSQPKEQAILRMYWYGSA